jgi:hypothetical protein
LICVKAAHGALPAQAASKARGVKGSQEMEEKASTFVVGVLMLVLGAIGLVLAVGARDAEIFIFGGSLLAFAVIFTASLVNPGLFNRGKGRTNG